MFSGEEKYTDSREYMVIGCGHASFNFDCEHQHPKSSFLTVDINPNQKPDLLMDSNLLATKKEMEGKFNAIIYENIPGDVVVDKSLNLMNLLKENGNLIYASMKLFITIKDLKEEGSFWIGFNESEFKNAIIIPKNNSNELKLDPVVEAYLKPLKIPSNTFFKVVVTSELKKRAAVLEKVKEELRGDLPDSILCHVLFNNKNDSKPPLTVKDLKEISNQYKPGFFREKLSKQGMTQGMREMNDYLANFSDERRVLSKDELTTIMRIVINRFHRTILTNTNPTRNRTGQTQKILNTIGELVMNELMQERDVPDKKPSSIVP